MVQHGASLTRESGDASIAEAVASGAHDELAPRQQALVEYALKLTTEPASVESTDITALRAFDLDDRAIVDANQIVAYFNYVNRVADGLGVELESTWPADLREPRRYKLAEWARFPTVARDSVPELDLDESREMDRLMIEEFGIPLERMMENAGRSVAEVCRAQLGGSAAGARVTVIAGRGGNGGGGLVAARHLADAGAQVAIVLSAEPERLAPTTASQWKIARRMGISSTHGPVEESDLVVDAIHGYSLRGDPRTHTADLISAVSTPLVVAVDVPSGLEVGAGALRTPHVRASATVALAAPKLGTFAQANRDAIGDLYVADISVPRDVFDRLEKPVAGDLFSRGGVVRVPWRDRSS